MVNNNKKLAAVAKAAKAVVATWCVWQALSLPLR